MDQQTFLCKGQVVNVLGFLPYCLIAMAQSGIVGESRCRQWVKEWSVCLFSASSAIGKQEVNLLPSNPPLLIPPAAMSLSQVVNCTFSSLTHLPYCSVVMPYLQVPV